MTTTKMEAANDVRKQVARNMRMQAEKLMKAAKRLESEHSLSAVHQVSMELPEPRLVQQLGYLQAMMEFE